MTKRNVFFAVLFVASVLLVGWRFGVARYDSGSSTGYDAAKAEWYLKGLADAPKATGDTWSCMVGKTPELTSMLCFVTYEACLTVYGTLKEAAENDPDFAVAECEMGIYVKQRVL